MRHCLRVFCGLYFGYPTESTKAANSSHGGYCLTRPKSRTAWEELVVLHVSKQVFLVESKHEKKNYRMTCVLSEDSDQPAHLHSLIRVFAGDLKKHWVLGYPLSVEWRLTRLHCYAGWSLSSQSARVFIGFVMHWLISSTACRIFGFGYIFLKKKKQQIFNNVDINVINSLSSDTTKPAKWVCSQRRLRSA